MSLPYGITEDHIIKLIAHIREQDKALVEARAVINYYSLESRFPVDAQHTAFAKEWLLAHPAPKEG